MICPNCKTQNRTDANFCKRCGVLIAVNCPRCKAIVQDGANFCDHCGLPFGNPTPYGGWVAPQTSTAPEKEHSKPVRVSERLELDHLITREMRAKLNTARAENKMVGERRIVTMLFCDVKGSTKAAEHLDPEEWAEIMNGGFKYMIDPIYRYEGTVARLMGDAILAFFGAPIAHEDDPERAILAALDIVDEFTPYREKVLARWKIDFNVRVGINTGMVMVGQVGSDLQMEYTAMGDAINLASRMEQTAIPGTVQISEDTYKRASLSFEFEDLGFVEVKGKDEPVHTYRPLRRKSKAGHLRGIEDLEAPLIGRTSEWARLKAAADAVARGIGGIVFLIGEAGLGKSRLIRELKNDWDRKLGINNHKPQIPVSDLRPDWYETTSFSYEISQPYSIIQRLIRRIIGSTANDSAEVLRELLGILVKEMPTQYRTDARKVFESLFGLTSMDGTPPLEGELFKNELFRISKLLWEKRARERPIILVLDDLHWADPASIELLGHLFELTNEGPLLLICATRLERGTPGWRLRQIAEDAFAHRYNEINLRPLTEGDSRQLVENLLSVSDLPEELQSRIIEKTEGNPFFVEEVVRSLMDGKADDQDKIRDSWLAWSDEGEIDIPDNIQSLLIARIDRLRDDVRHTLQLAALIGRSFYFRVLEMIANNLPEALLHDHLNALQQMDLIREEARRPELEYSFRHALTQEAAYSTILLKRRRQFHRLVAEAIETIFSNQKEEMAATLAHHYEQAHVYDKALHFYTLAGNLAYRLYAVSVAIGHYKQAISFLDKVATNSEEVNFLYSRLGRSLELNSDFEEALQIYGEMEALARQRKDRALELSALVAQSTIFSNVSDQGDPERGEDLSARALLLAQELEDEATEAKIQWNQLNALRFSEKIVEAVAAGERALKLARKLDLPDQRAIVANDLSLPLVAAGHFGRAREVLKEARDLWRELGNQPMLADSLATASMVHSFEGDYDRALAFSDEAFQISNSIRNSWGQSYSRFGAGNVYWQRGDPARAIAMLETSLRFGQEANFSVAGTWSQAYLARLYVRLGQIERGNELAHTAVAHAEKHAPPWQPLAMGVLAQIYFYRGHLEKANEIIQDRASVSTSAYGRFLSFFQMEEPAIRIALARGDPEFAVRVAGETVEKIRRFSYFMYLPEALYIQSQALLAAGQAEAAKDALQEARREAEGTDSRWVLWQILAAQARMSLAQGDLPKANTLSARAREMVEHIADNTGAEELRISFLSQPEVQSLFDHSEASA